MWSPPRASGDFCLRTRVSRELSPAIACIQVPGLLQKDIRGSCKCGLANARRPLQDPKAPVENPAERRFTVWSFAHFSGFFQHPAGAHI